MNVLHFDRSLIVIITCYFEIWYFEIDIPAENSCEDSVMRSFFVLINPVKTLRKEHFI